MKTSELKTFHCKKFAFLNELSRGPEFQNDI